MEPRPGRAGEHEGRVLDGVELHCGKITREPVLQTSLVVVSVRNYLERMHDDLIGENRAVTSVASRDLIG